jgi:hypothetical protein
LAPLFKKCSILTVAMGLWSARQIKGRSGRTLHRPR